MKKIIAISSAKSGVGKSTLCCNLGKVMANNNEKTILVETDSGFRNLDIPLDVKDIIYDLGDYLKKNCDLKDAIKTTYVDNLFLLPAPFKFDISIKHNDINMICNKLKENFDNIILDLKSEIEMAKQIQKIVDYFLVIVTTNSICIRDTVLFLNHININENNLTKARLIINKVEKNFMKNSHFKSLDDIIDETKIQLLAVIPYNDYIKKTTEFAIDFKKHKTPFKFFKAIAKRLDNENVNLILK